jgi:YgiT-type zinc finger domain-containing protein
MLEDTVRQLADWQRATPKATFAEIEDAVEEQLAQVRGHLIADLLNTRSSAEQATGERPICPECGQAMEQRGEKERAVTVRGNQTVRFRRRQTVCPACGAGLFPPR